MPRYVPCPNCKKACPFDPSGKSKYADCPGCGRSVFLSPDLATSLADLDEVEQKPRPNRDRDRDRDRDWDRDRRSRRDRDDDRDREWDRPGRDRREEEEEPARPAGAGKPTYKDAPSTYHHPQCDGRTTISEDIVRKIAADPWGIITSTVCARCNRSVSLAEVEWVETEESVSAYRARLRREMPIILTILRFALGPLFGMLLGLVLAVLFNMNNPTAGIGLGVLLGFIGGATVGYLVVGWIWQAVASPRIPHD